MLNWLDGRWLILVGAALIILLAVLAMGRDNLEAKVKKGMGKTGPGGAITGTLSDRGVECQGMIGDDGRFYTLTNVDRKKMVAGTRVRVTGKARRVSKCMQGTTIAVDTITPLK